MNGESRGKLMATVSCYFFEYGCILDWPAWIQAIGSIGAIFIAIWVSRKDRNHAYLLTKDSILRKLKVTYSIFEIASEVNKSIQHDIDRKNVLNGSYTKKFSIDGLKDLIFQLNNAPIFEYENERFSEIVIKTIRNLKLITEKLESINQSNLVYNDQIERDITNAINFIDSFKKPMQDIICAQEKLVHK